MLIFRPVCCSLVLVWCENDLAWNLEPDWSCCMYTARSQLSSHTNENLKEKGLFILQETESWPRLGNETSCVRSVLHYQCFWQPWNYPKLSKVVLFPYILQFMFAYSSLYSPLQWVDLRMTLRSVLTILAITCDSYDKALALRSWRSSYRFASGSRPAFNKELWICASLIVHV